MQLRITHYGEPILREKGKPVKAFDPALRALAENMVETMHVADGAGLAAQQVGEALQLFVMDIGSDGRAMDFDYRYDERVVPLPLIMPMVVCNPRIESLGDEIVDDAEGCLSFPGMVLEGVPRQEAIRMDFQDAEGVAHVLECNGFLARCCQHEYDHLQGVLFIDRVSKTELKRHEAELEAFRKETEAFLEAFE